MGAGRPTQLTAGRAPLDQANGQELGQGQLDRPQLIDRQVLQIVGRGALEGRQDVGPALGAVQPIDPDIDRGDQAMIERHPGRAHEHQAAAGLQPQGGGLAGRTPVWAAVFGFFVFASVGLPGLSGFVGEFLVLVGTFQANPGAAAVATFVMILAAGYLLFMYGRIVFGELSDFLTGLGNRLTDMTPVEILTLVPLATLVVIFGVQPGLLLNLFSSTITETLGAVRPAAPIAIADTAVIGGIVLLLAGIVVRTGWVLLRPSRPALEPEGGAAH